MAKLRSQKGMTLQAKMIIASCMFASLYLTSAKLTNPGKGTSVLVKNPTVDSLKLLLQYTGTNDPLFCERAYLLLDHSYILASSPIKQQKLTNSDILEFANHDSDSINRRISSRNGNSPLTNKIIKNTIEFMESSFKKVNLLEDHRLHLKLVTCLIKTGDQSVASFMSDPDRMVLVNQELHLLANKNKRSRDESVDSNQQDTSQPQEEQKSFKYQTNDDIKQRPTNIATSTKRMSFSNRHFGQRRSMQSPNIDRSDYYMPSSVSSIVTTDEDEHTDDYNPDANDSVVDKVTRAGMSKSFVANSGIRNAPIENNFYRLYAKIKNDEEPRLPSIIRYITQNSGYISNQDKICFIYIYLFQHPSEFLLSHKDEFASKIQSIQFEVPNKETLANFARKFTKYPPSIDKQYMSLYKCLESYRTESDEINRLLELAEVDGLWNDVMDPRLNDLFECQI